MLTIIDTTSLYISVSHHCNKNENDDFKIYKDTLDEWFQTILDETKATEYLAFDDDKPSFRHLLFPDFKDDRKRAYFKFVNDIRHYAKEKWSIRSFKGLESDDLFSMSNSIHKDKEIVLAHIDGDLDQIEGKHYNYHYRSKNWSNGFYEITSETASLNLSNSILAGSHNNNKGLDGCGEKSSEKYLTNLSTKGVLNAFINGINKEEYGIYKSIKGLGMTIGIEEFRKNVLMSKLLTNIDEANYWLSKVNLPLVTNDMFIHIKIQTKDNGITNW